MRVVDIHIVSGAEGASLLVCNPSGGYRIAGPKAWGNPENKPLFTFIIDADELTKCISKIAYDLWKKADS